MPHSAFRPQPTLAFGSLIAAATLLFAAPLSAHSSSANPGDGPAVAVAPVASHKLAEAPGKSITLVRVKFPPGSKSPSHRHAGAVTVFVLSGAIRSQINDEPIVTYKAGDSFFEARGVTHAVAENASATEPAEALAIFFANDGATLTVPTK